MTVCQGSNCASVWGAAERNKRAEAIDCHAPACGCEQTSLRNPPGNPVGNDELIIRVLTSPDGFDVTNGEILTRKLTALFSSGVSVIRQGASDIEIRQTVSELTNAAEPNCLVACVLVRVSAIRSLEGPERSFCVYDTEDSLKSHHADIVCPMPNMVSKNQNRRKEEERRRSLRLVFEQHIKIVSDVKELISAIREAEHALT